LTGGVPKRGTKRGGKSVSKSRLNGGERRDTKSTRQGESRESYAQRVRRAGRRQNLRGKAKRKPGLQSKEGYTGIFLQLERNKPLSEEELLERRGVVTDVRARHCRLLLKFLPSQWRNRSYKSTLSGVKGAGKKTMHRRDRKNKKNN